jgi:hypothetical protein
MTEITFEFDTSAYERTHGKAPKGYGSWAFDWQGSRRPQARLGAHLRLCRRQAVGEGAHL